MPVDDRCIDKQVLLPIAIAAARRLKCDAEGWTAYEVEQVRDACGPEWAGLSLDNVRKQCCSLRKNGHLPRHTETKNRGARKRDPVSPEYAAYLKSQWWRAFRLRVLEFWEWRCALCNGEHKLDVHHRTYQRLNCEQMNDCICLCRECHRAADRARQREEKVSKAEQGFWQGQGPPIRLRESGNGAP